MEFANNFISEAKNLSFLLEDINKDAIKNNSVLEESDPKRVVEIDPIYLDGVFVAFHAASAEFLINRFIIYTHEYWELINDMNEEFISKRFSTIFGGVDKVKNIDFDKFLKSNLTKEDKEDIWDHLKNMKNIADNWALTTVGKRSLILEAKNVMNLCTDDFYERMSKFSHRIILENVEFYPEDD